MCGCLQSGKTALHKAAEDGHSDVVKVLLEKGGGADLAKIQDAVSESAHGLDQSRRGKERVF